MSGKIRCAIYTRKSTDEGLDQNFNSLDAQREASEAFIQSQRGLGWITLKKHYDDGGISGGTMDRPALQEMLTDIQDEKIDLIVVYKVDRLTRSLMDFSRIIESFDESGVSFVSVTQQFNTANSMGRLTLNVLLSFAQFEREVTAERIRDKIAASRKKGMWMGGQVPLGYDAREKKLKVNKVGAETIRKLFQLYLDLGSVYAVKKAADKLGLVSKRRKSGQSSRGGIDFSRGHIYHLLRNPIYKGEVRHKDKIYPGQHDSIVSLDTWNAVQNQLDTNSRKRSSPTNIKQGNLLTGLIFDESGKTLSPTYTSKNGRRYRYYISKDLVHEKNQVKNGWRLPAKTLENLVIKSLAQLLVDEISLVSRLEIQNSPPDKIQSVIKFAADIANQLSSDDETSRYKTARDLLVRVVLDSEHIHIEIDTSQFCDSLGKITYEVPMEMRRRWVESKIVLLPKNITEPDEKLIRLVANTRHWFEQMTSGKANSVREIARQNDIDENDVSRFLPLAFLAPNIVETILSGKQPPELTSEKLKRLVSLPLSWQEQRQKLEMNS